MSTAAWTVRPTLDAILDTLNDKPLVFTEWGGLFVFENPKLFARFQRYMLDALAPTRRWPCTCWQLLTGPGPICTNTAAESMHASMESCTKALWT